MDIPKTIPALKERLQFFGVSQSDLDKLQDVIEEEDYNLEEIYEDVRHGIQESMLVESFKESYEAKESLYHLIKCILDGDVNGAFKHFIGVPISWHNLVESLKHQISQSAGKALESTIADLLRNSEESEPFQIYDLSLKNVDCVLKAMRFNRKMNSKEIKFIHELVNRAHEFRTGRNDFAFPEAKVTVAKLEMDDETTGVNAADFSTKWKGFNAQTLLDVYAVHKCHKFTFQQMTEYSFSEFVRDVITADEAIFGNIGISAFVERPDIKKRADTLSLFPSWIINDDVFSIISIIYGVTDYIQKLGQNECSSTRAIRVYVIPESVVSVYDQSVCFLVDIPNIEEFLIQKESDIYLFRCDEISSTSNTAVDIGSVIQKLHQDIRTIEELRGEIRGDAPLDIVVLFDRRDCSKTGNQNVVLFECRDWVSFSELRCNNLIGFDLEFEHKQHVDERDVVRAYLNYGEHQRTRFYPEFMVSVVSKLFVSPTDMTEYEVINKLYSSECKHGWNVNLDDEQFNVIYKAITGFNHETNNYYRPQMRDRQDKGRFLDFARRKLSEYYGDAAFPILDFHLKDQHYDSDAVIQDVLIQCPQKEKSSNIKQFLRENGGSAHDQEWNTLEDAALEWEQNRCGGQKVLDMADCVRIRRLIGNLCKFQAVHHIVNDDNMKLFNLEQIIGDFDHLVTVHNMFSDDNTMKIQQYILERISCQIPNECVVVNRIRSRRQSKNDGKRRRGTPLNAVSPKCAVLRDSLNELHCYLMHQTDELYRLSADDEQYASRFSSLVTDEGSEDYQKDDEKEQEPLSIDFGVSVLQWLKFGEEPEFESLRDEMIHNEDLTVTQDGYDRMQIVCAQKIKNNEFGDYELDEMVGLKFYSDYTKDCASVRKAHWKSSSLQKKRSHYQWALTLYRSALRHAKPIPIQSGSLKVASWLYHGLTVFFRMDRESPTYFGPFSTTLSKNVADTFSKQQGLRLHVKSGYADALTRCLGIDMRSISAFKHEQEVLLVDQVIPIQSTKAFETGDEASINHLLFSLKTRPTQIMDPDKFYRELGTKYKNEWIEMIAQHHQLHAKTLYERKTVKHRMAHELNINEHFVPRVIVEAIKRITVDDNLYISDPSMPNNVQQLKARDIINLKRDNQWTTGAVSRIFSDALCVRTVQNGIYTFRWLENAALSDEVRLKFPQQNMCSQYQFAFQKVRDDESMRALRRFPDLQSFNIPFGDLYDSLYSLPRNVQSLSEVLELVQIGVAVRDDDWDSVLPLQTVQIPTVLTGAITSNNSESFRICRSINMIRCNGRNGGKLSVISSSSIIVEEKGGINGSKCGLQKGSKRQDPELLKYGRYIGSECDEKSDTEITEGAGGGVLILFATQSVVNNGVLLCEPSKGGLFSGGSICILSVGSFVNGGRMSCGMDGMIRISCREFVNRGLMTPAPFIQINDGQSVGFGFKELALELKEQRMKLSVVEHRGHWRSHHPRNLLESGSGEWYLSSDECGPPNDDWIVFRMDTVRPMFIIGIGIRNHHSGYAIKRISIEGSVDGKAFEHWIQINDIKKGYDELQRFDVDIVSSHYAVANEWKFYKMRILENYGYDEGNAFYEFVMFGVGK